MSVLRFIVENGSLIVQYGAYVLAIIGIISVGLKVWAKAKSGKVKEAKEEAHKIADKLVDILVDVIEKYDLGDVKKAVAEEVEKDTNVKAALDNKLDENGYLNKRKKDRGN